MLYVGYSQTLHKVPHPSRASLYASSITSQWQHMICLWAKRQYIYLIHHEPVLLLPHPSRMSSELLCQSQFSMPCRISCAVASMKVTRRLQHASPAKKCFENYWPVWTRLCILQYHRAKYLRLLCHPNTTTEQGQQIQSNLLHIQQHEARLQSLLRHQKTPLKQIQWVKCK
jgi:hypothetical protein